MRSPGNTAQAAVGFGGTGGRRKEKSLYRFEIAHFAEEKQARRTLFSGGFRGFSTWSRAVCRRKALIFARNRTQKRLRNVPSMHDDVGRP
jgi:hypothetical protein